MTVRGTFVCRGNRYGTQYSGTILLKDITRVDGTSLTDHHWFPLTRGFERLALQQGDIVEFSATIARYWKGGYQNQGQNILKPLAIDYGLQRLTNIRKVETHGPGEIVKPQTAHLSAANGGDVRSMKAAVSHLPTGSVVL